MAKPQPKASAMEAMRRAKGAAPKRPGKPKQTFLGSTMTLAAVLATLVFALPTALVIFVGFLPTLVAWMVDVTPRRYVARTVAGLNFVGVLPYVVKLWSGQNDIVGAGRMITDPFALVVMFGAAALGWAMYIGFPGIVAAMSTLSANRRISQLRERQRALIEEWGAAVTAQERRQDDPAAALPPPFDRDRAA